MMSEKATGNFSSSVTSHSWSRTSSACSLSTLSTWVASSAAAGDVHVRSSRYKQKMPTVSPPASRGSYVSGGCAGSLAFSSLPSSESAAAAPWLRWLYRRWGPPSTPRGSLMLASSSNAPPGM